MSIYSNIENDNLEFFLSDFDEENILDYLFFAVEYKAYTITNYILNEYNLVNTYKEVFGKSLMSLASENNDVKMLKLLLKNSENINGNPLSLFNPLEISLIDRKEEFFFELLRSGVDVNFFLPRHNRTILDTALMYDNFENKDYSLYINELKKNNSISSRDYSSSKINSTKFKILNDYFGNVINYSFKFDVFLNPIYIGFLDKKTNYIFIESEDVVYMVFLPFDWPLNNQDDYLKTNYCFFFNFLNIVSLNFLNEVDYVDLIDFKDELIFKPNNIKGFQVVDINLGFNVKIFSPIESRKKKFSNQLDEKDLIRMKYEWPKNKRGLNIYEGFFCLI